MLVVGFVILGLFVALKTLLAPALIIPKRILTNTAFLAALMVKVLGVFSDSQYLSLVLHLHHQAVVESCLDNLRLHDHFDALLHESCRCSHTVCHASIEDIDGHSC